MTTTQAGRLAEDRILQGSRSNVSPRDKLIKKKKKEENTITQS